MFKHVRIAVLGAGDLASGVIYRLHRVGFSVFATELPAPVLVRRTVCFGEAVYSGQVSVEGVHAQRVDNLSEILPTLQTGVVPVYVNTLPQKLTTLAPLVVVDARMEKRNLGIDRQLAPLVIALGPGFTAGKDVHAVIETNRGHNLGRVIWQGSAEPDTGTPGLVNGKGQSRVLRAPVAGHVVAYAHIGDFVKAGQVVAHINETPITAPFDGVLRGMIHERVAVTPNMKIGDLDPRADRQACFTLSDKSLAVGGGVLEAVLSAQVVQATIQRAQA